MSPGNYETWLDDGQLVCLDSTLPATDKQDILQSTLYFQLAASKKVNKLQHVERWFDAYQNCLRGLGWKVLREGQVQERYPHLLAFTLSDVVQALVRNGLPIELGDLQQVLPAGGSALTSLGLEHFFQHSFGVLNNSDGPLHQVAIFLSVARADACMHGLLIHFKTRQVVSGDITRAIFKCSSLQGEVAAVWLSARPDPWQFPDYQEVMTARLQARTTGELVRIDRPELRVGKGGE